MRGEECVTFEITLCYGYRDLPFSWPGTCALRTCSRGTTNVGAPVDGFWTTKRASRRAFATGSTKEPRRSLALGRVSVDRLGVLRAATDDGADGRGGSSSGGPDHARGPHDPGGGGDARDGAEPARPRTRRDRQPGQPDVGLRKPSPAACGHGHRDRAPYRRAAARRHAGARSRPDAAPEHGGRPVGRASGLHARHAGHRGPRRLRLDQPLHGRDVRRCAPCGAPRAHRPGL